MNPTYFTKTEAESLIGCNVEALSEFPSVPAGTTGTVVKARQDDPSGWVVCVEWKCGRQGSDYFAMLGDLSFNLHTKGKPLADEFRKDEFERLVSSSAQARR